MHYLQDRSNDILGKGFLPIEAFDENTSLLSVTVKDTGKKEMDLRVDLKCAPFPLSLHTQDAKAKAIVSVLLKKCSDTLLGENTDWMALLDETVNYLSDLNS